MKIIDKYLSRQVLFGTIFAVVVLSVVLVLGQAFKKLLKVLENYDVSIGFIVEFLLNALPSSLTLTIPWGFLTATLLLFGRLSADNELISFKMAGLSMFRICASLFALALILTVVSFLLNVYFSPKSKQRLQEMVVEQVRSDPMAVFVAGEGSDRIPGHLSYVEKKDGTNLSNLFLIKLEDKKVKGRKKKVKKVPASFVHAKVADVNHLEDEKGFLLKLDKVHFIKSGAGYPNRFEGFKHGIKASEHAIPVYTSRIIGESIRANPFIMTNGEIKQALRTEKNIEKKRKNGMYFEISQRYALSLASITFILIGIPLGITAQRRETSVGFVLSLCIALVYFFFIIVAGWYKEDSGFFPHLLVWLPNLIFISLGLFLFYRVSKK